MGSSSTDWATTAPPIQIRDIHVSPEQARLQIQIPRPILFTSELPDFDQRLLQCLPSLRSTICHNEDGLSFADELRATEMGHVVEHMVLALLTEQGIYAKGTTEWDWFTEPEGSFTITLFGRGFDPPTVTLAVAGALRVLEPLLPLTSSNELQLR